MILYCLFEPDLRPSTGHQLLVRTETLLGGTGADVEGNEKENEEKELFNKFPNVKPLIFTVCLRL